MSASLEPSQPRQRSNGATTQATSAILALVPFVAYFLGGATQKWAEGIVLVMLGLYLLVRPPRRSLGLITNCILAGVVAAAGIAFLPANWFSFSTWRIAATDDL